MTSQNDILSQNSLVIVEIENPEGGIDIKVHIEGDSDSADPEAVASLGYLVAATLFGLFTDGTVAKRLEETFGLSAGALMTRLETE